MVCRGTIDERMLSLYHEKRDSAHLALDGELNEECVEHVDLASLLGDAVRDFDASTATVCEKDIAAQWPALRARLGLAEARFRELSTSNAQRPTPNAQRPTPNAQGRDARSPLAVHLARIKAKRAGQRH